MPPILIIGAGIGGLALAASLHKRGLSALVYERAPELKEVGASLGLWPNATRVLKHLGALDRLMQTSHVAEAGALRNQRGRILKKMVVIESDVPGIAAHRADTLAAIASVVPPDWIHLSKSCISI